MKVASETVSVAAFISVLKWRDCGIAVDTMNIIICPSFRASTAPLVCLLYNKGQKYLLHCVASAEGNYAHCQTLKTLLAYETSMRPAATRPAWRHERVELERVVDCRGG